MKRSLIILMAMLLCVMLLTGCASKNNTSMTPMPNPTANNSLGDNAALLPEGTDNLMPDVSMAPVIGSSLTQNGVTTVETARRVAEQMEDELERLSEVTDAQVVAIGNKAAVALQFDSQYRSGVDERLRGMVEERVKGVAAGVERVYVTSDLSVFEALNTLGKRLETAADLTDVQAELDRLIAQMSTVA